MQGGGEHVADVAFTHQGGFVVCLTKDERLVLLTGSGMLLRTFSTAAAREPNLSPPAPKISLKKLYDQTAVRLPIGALFLSVSAAAATNDVACSNGVVAFGLGVGRGLETATDLAELALAKAEAVLVIVRAKRRRKSLDAFEMHRGGERTSVQLPKADKRSGVNQLIEAFRRRFTSRNVDGRSGLDEGDTAWKVAALKTDVGGATLERSLFYLKHTYLLSLLLLGRERRRRRQGRRQWRRLTDKLGDLLLGCLQIELDSGAELRQSKAAAQIFQMLEAARAADEGQRHFRFFLGLISGFARGACAHGGTSAAAAFLAVERMVSSAAAAYPKVSKAGLKKLFLPECYRAIHEKAGARRELAVLSKIQMLFQLLGISLAPGPPQRARSRASLAFYKGQYAKAVFHWTREVVNPKTEREVKEARLLSILYTLFQTSAVPELLLFLNWAYERELPGFPALLGAFLNVVGDCHSGSDEVRLPLPPETIGKPTASSFFHGKRFLTEALSAFPGVFARSAIFRIALASGNAACCRAMCRNTKPRWNDKFLIELILEIEDQQSKGGADIAAASGKATKFFLTEINFHRAPNKSLATDLMSLSACLPGLEHVKSEVGASIESLLQSAEDLLSRCQLVDVGSSGCDYDDEEEFDDTEREKECRVSLGTAVKWLEVLFRSGLAPDFAAQCPTDAEAFSAAGGDWTFFRLVRVKHTLR